MGPRSFLTVGMAQNPMSRTENKHRRLRGGEKQADWLAKGPGVMVVFPGISVGLIYLRLETGKVNNLEMPERTEEKHPKRNLLSQAKGAGRGSRTRQKIPRG